MNKTGCSLVFADGPGGTAYEHARGFAHKGLFLHRTLGATETDCWSISHASSGRAVVRGPYPFSVARDLMLAIADLVDWTKDAKTLRRLEKSLVRSIAVEISCLIARHQTGGDAR